MFQDIFGVQGRTEFKHIAKCRKQDKIESLS